MENIEGKILFIELGSDSNNTLVVIENPSYYKKDNENYIKGNWPNNEKISSEYAGKEISIPEKSILQCTTFDTIEEVEQRFFKRRSIKSLIDLPMIMYLTGTGIVLASYLTPINPKIGWAGWVVGMLGWVIQAVRR